MLRWKESAKDECSSSASIDDVGDRKEALVLDGCRRKAGLGDVGTSFRGTYVKSIKPKCADIDEPDQTIVRRTQARLSTGRPTVGRPETPPLCYLSWFATGDCRNPPKRQVWRT